MKLNKTKSFYRSHFRESCGIHAYNGQDITPVYVKHTPYHNTLESYISLINNEYQLYTKRWTITSQYVRDFVLKCMTFPACMRKIECTAKQSLACFIRPPTSQLIDTQKKFLRKRWNEDLQCNEYRVPRLKKRIETEFITDELHAYLRWMFMHTQDFSSREVGDSSGDLTIAWGWVPESAMQGPEARVTLVQRHSRCRVHTRFISGTNYYEDLEMQRSVKEQERQYS